MADEIVGHKTFSVPGGGFRHEPLTRSEADELMERVRITYRGLASANHPDRGGSTERMAEINAAWEQAQKELGNG